MFGSGLSVQMQHTSADDGDDSADKPDLLKKIFARKAEGSSLDNLGMNSTGALPVSKLKRSVLKMNKLRALGTLSENYSCESLKKIATLKHIIALVCCGNTFAVRADEIRHLAQRIRSHNGMKTITPLRCELALVGLTSNELCSIIVEARKYHETILQQFTDILMDQYENISRAFKELTNYNVNNLFDGRDCGTKENCDRVFRCLDLPEDESTGFNGFLQLLYGSYRIERTLPLVEFVSRLTVISKDLIYAFRRHFLLHHDGFINAYNSMCGQVDHTNGITIHSYEERPIRPTASEEDGNSHNKLQGHIQKQVDDLEVSFKKLSWDAFFDEFKEFHDYYVKENQLKITTPIFSVAQNVFNYMGVGSRYKDGEEKNSLTIVDFCRTMSTVAPVCSFSQFRIRYLMHFGNWKAGFSDTKGSPGLIWRHDFEFICSLLDINSTDARNMFDMINDDGDESIDWAEFWSRVVSSALEFTIAEAALRIFMGKEAGKDINSVFKKIQVDIKNGDQRLLPEAFAYRIFGIELPEKEHSVTGDKLVDADIIKKGRMTTKLPDLAGNRSTEYWDEPEELSDLQEETTQTQATKDTSKDSTKLKHPRTEARNSLAQSLATGFGKPNIGKKYSSIYPLRTCPKMIEEEVTELYSLLKKKHGKVTLNILYHEVSQVANEFMSINAVDYEPGEAIFMRYKITREMQKELLGHPFIAAVPKDMKWTTGGGGAWFLGKKQITVVPGPKQILRPKVLEGCVQLNIHEHFLDERFEIRLFSSVDGVKIGQQIGTGIGCDVIRPKPCPPKPIFSSGTPTSMEIFWQPPKLQGADAPIIGYVVQSVPDVAPTFHSIQHDDMEKSHIAAFSNEENDIIQDCISYKMENLNPGGNYEVSVAAVHQNQNKECFVGKYSISKTITCPTYTKPDKCSGLTVKSVRRPNDIEFCFNAPLQNNFSTVDSYTLYWNQQPDEEAKKAGKAANLLEMLNGGQKEFAAVRFAQKLKFKSNIGKLKRLEAKSTPSLNNKDLENGAAEEENRDCMLVAGEYFFPVTNFSFRKVEKGPDSVLSRRMCGIAKIPPNYFDGRSVRFAVQAHNLGGNSDPSNPTKEVQLPRYEGVQFYDALSDASSRVMRAFENGFLTFDANLESMIDRILQIPEFVKEETEENLQSKQESAKWRTLEKKVMQAGGIDEFLGALDNLDMCQFSQNTRLIDSIGGAGTEEEIDAWCRVGEKIAEGGGILQLDVLDDLNLPVLQSSKAQIEASGIFDRGTQDSDRNFLLQQLSETNISSLVSSMEKYGINFNDLILTAPMIGQIAQGDTIEWNELVTTICKASCGGVMEGPQLAKQMLQYISDLQTFFPLCKKLAPSCDDLMILLEKLVIAEIKAVPVDDPTLARQREWQRVTERQSAFDPETVNFLYDIQDIEEGGHAIILEFLESLCREFGTFHHFVSKFHMFDLEMLDHLIRLSHIGGINSDIALDKNEEGVSIFDDWEFIAACIARQESSEIRKLIENTFDEETGTLKTNIVSSKLGGDRLQKLEDMIEKCGDMEECMTAMTKMSEIPGGFQAFTNLCEYRKFSDISVTVEKMAKHNFSATPDNVDKIFEIVSLIGPLIFIDAMEDIDYEIFTETMGVARYFSIVDATFSPKEVKDLLRRILEECKDMTSFQDKFHKVNLGFLGEIAAYLLLADCCPRRCLEDPHLNKKDKGKTSGSSRQSMTGCFVTHDTEMVERRQAAVGVLKWIARAGGCTKVFATIEGVDGSALGMIMDLARACSITGKSDSRQRAQAWSDVAFYVADEFELLRKTIQEHDIFTIMDTIIPLQCDQGQLRVLVKKIEPVGITRFLDIMDEICFTRLCEIVPILGSTCIFKTRDLKAWSELISIITQYPSTENFLDQVRMLISVNFVEILKIVEIGEILTRSLEYCQIWTANVKIIMEAGGPEFFYNSFENLDVEDFVGLLYQLKRVGLCRLKVDQSHSKDPEARVSHKNRLLEDFVNKVLEAGGFEVFWWILRDQDLKKLPSYLHCLEVVRLHMVKAVGPTEHSNWSWELLEKPEEFEILFSQLSTQRLSQHIAPTQMEQLLNVLSTIGVDTFLEDYKGVDLSDLAEKRKILEQEKIPNNDILQKLCSHWRMLRKDSRNLWGLTSIVQIIVPWIRGFVLQQNTPLPSAWKNLASQMKWLFRGIDQGCEYLRNATEVTNITFTPMQLGQILITLSPVGGVDGFLKEFRGLDLHRCARHSRILKESSVLADHTVDVLCQIWSKVHRDKDYLRKLWNFLDTVTPWLPSQDWEQMGRAIHIVGQHWGRIDPHRFQFIIEKGLEVEDVALNSSWAHVLQVAKKEMKQSIPKPMKSALEKNMDPIKTDPVTSYCYRCGTYMNYGLVPLKENTGRNEERAIADADYNNSRESPDGGSILPVADRPKSAHQWGNAAQQEALYQTIFGPHHGTGLNFYASIPKKMVRGKRSQSATGLRNVR